MPGRRLGPATMSEIDRHLPRPLPRRWRRRLTLVVVARSEGEASRLDLSSSRWRDARTVRLVGRSQPELQRELAALRDVHLVVDLRPADGPEQREAFEHGFLHLAALGRWVALRSTGPLRGSEPLTDLARALQEPRPLLALGEPWREHVRSVSQVHVTRDLVVFGKRKKHLLRLREDDVPTLLVAREPAVRFTEIQRLPGGSLDTGGRVHDHGVEPRVRVPEVLAYPDHVVRRYEGRVHLPRGPLAYQGRTVLPESFRWHLGPLDVPGLITQVDDFARTRDPKPTETLDGSYFHFLYANPGHFGHLMTEALSRLWGWPAAKQADPSLKMLCRRRPGAEKPGLEATLLPAFGVAEDDIVWVDGGVTVSSLVGCTPMWHNWPPFYAHPAIRETWTRLRTGLVGADPPHPAPHVFVTRRGFNRPCSNHAEVERFFADRGFVVVAPEELSVAEQVQTFAGARVIAGFGGAGMFNLAYAGAVETVIVLNHSAYHARNEHLYAAVLGAQLHTFWSRPDLDHPPDRLSYRAHQSAWAFDFDRNGGPLARLLDELVP